MIFDSYDHKPIYVREWTEVDDPVGVVQIAHGMNEYAARYEKFARRLNEMGYAAIGDQPMFDGVCSGINEAKGGGELGKERQIGDHVSRAAAACKEDGTQGRPPSWFLFSIFPILCKYYRRKRVFSVCPLQIRKIRL